MATWKRTLEKVLSGSADGNIRFQDLRKLLKRFDFAERIKGDHHIFTKAGLDEILNLQPNGSQAKPYQVKQVRQIMAAYGLATDDESSEDFPQEDQEPAE